MVSAQGVGILTGPTATGKTALALRLALGHGAIELVNADSLLVYRGMDIGTAKPTREELAAVRHHLIDVREPDQPYNAGDFHREALAAIADIEARGKRALVVGGTGFYLKALTHGLWDAPPADPAVRARLETQSNTELHAALAARDPEAAGRIALPDRYRLIRALEVIEQSGRTVSDFRSQKFAQPDPRFKLWVVDLPDSELRFKIAERTRAMLAAGLLEEARALRERFPGAAPLKSVGYSQALAFLDGRPPEGRKVEPGLPGLESEITLATRQLVKRQRTWFKAQAYARRFSDVDFQETYK